MRRFISTFISVFLSMVLLLGTMVSFAGATPVDRADVTRNNSSLYLPSTDSTTTPPPAPKPVIAPVYKKVKGYTSSTSKKTKAYAKADGKSKVLVTYKTVKKITFTETGKKGWYTAPVKVGKKTKTGYFKSSEIDWLKTGKARKQKNVAQPLKIYKSPTSTKVIKKLEVLKTKTYKPVSGQWYKTTYKVKKGKKTKTVTGYVKKADLDQAQKIIKNKTRWILIDQSKFKLYLYKGGKLEKKYGCTLGAPGYSTPKGTFKITLKRYLPTWGNPDKAGWGKNMPDTIAPGPNNPLGLRALNLNVSGIRIHGSARPQIGTRSSHGCIRLTNKNVVDLYKRVKVGTSVYIRK